MDYIETVEAIKENQKSEIIEAIKNNCLYDFIVNNSYRIENDVLRDLLYETIATLKENQYAELIDNLKEYRDF